MRSIPTADRVEAKRPDCIVEPAGEVGAGNPFLFDPDKQETRPPPPLRSKGKRRMTNRYFPRPDLLPLVGIEQTSG